MKGGESHTCEGTGRRAIDANKEEGEKASRADCRVDGLDIRVRRKFLYRFHIVVSYGFVCIIGMSGPVIGKQMNYERTDGHPPLCLDGTQPVATHRTRRPSTTLL